MFLVSSVAQRMDSSHDDIDEFNLFKLIKAECYDLLDIALENLQLYNFSIDDVDPNGATLLHLAVSKGTPALAICEKVVQMGARVNVPNSANKETPLHVACATGALDLIKLLTENKGDMKAQDCNGANPLFHAVKNGHLAVLKHFQSQKDLFLNTNKEHNTILETAIMYKNAELVEFLAQLGTFPLNQQSLNGYTALHLAVTTLHVPTLNSLLEANPDLTVIDFKGRNLLHIAVSVRSFSAVRILIEKGCDVNCQDCNGETPLHYASYLKLERIVFLLLHHKADPNLQDLDGRSALHVAAKDSVDILRVLLENGADRNVLTLNGDSALHVAASMGNYNVVAKLVSEGEEKSVVNKDGRSALILAQMGGHEKVEGLLNGEEVRKQGEEHTPVKKSVTFSLLQRGVGGSA